MTFIDAFLDRKTDLIHVAEKDNDRRILKSSPAEYVFYYEDDAGQYRSIFGHACKKFSTNDSRKFRAALSDARSRGRRIFESDINPVLRFLADNYASADIPVLNIGFFDIEVDYHQTKGFAPPDDPFNAVTAITLYKSHTEELITLVLRPPTVTMDEAQRIVASFENTFLFDDEKELLDVFLDLIADTEVLSGWNSSAYDVPYLVNRVRQVLNFSAANRFCLWDQKPSEREYLNKFGRTIKTYDYIGRVHLDYIDLYIKHNTQQRLSYALNAIGEIEVGETKTAYEGTLDDLYKKDFQRFIEYNRQDVMLMVKIDQKNKFIELANQIAHANCVPLKTTMGSVALIEQAIINEMHAMGRVVPDRKARETDSVDDDMPDEMREYDDEDSAPGGDDHIPVVGAYVAQPKQGLHEHVGAVDINSLYPSAIRSLNMSPETLVGQVRPIETMACIRDKASRLTATQRAEAWEGIFETLEVTHMRNRDDAVLTVDFFNHLTDEVRTVEMTGAELYDYVFDDANAVCITSNSTIFSTKVDGMIPALLEKWYAERIVNQRKAREFAEMAAVEPERKVELLAKAERYHFLQYAQKIRLNSLYGALLNTACRFESEVSGQSTTLSGRTIVQHMNAKVNEVITEVYDYRGSALQYSDTDSVYFSAYGYLKDRPEYQGFEWTREYIIQLYDAIAEAVNDSFPEFMAKTFHTTLARGSLIKAGRELVASRALFIKKKKYSALVYDLEGTRLDTDGKPGKLKAMGLDLKRADTPRFMQQFLETFLIDLLKGKSKQELFDDIKQFRKAFKTRPGWEKGAPKKVSNLSKFAAKLNASNKQITTTLHRGENLRINMPGHVTASLNYNLLCDINNDRFAMRIVDSSRIIVCKLLKNSYGMTSIAYPIDEPHLPKWFLELPFNHTEMEQTIVDNKLMNLVGVLEWDLTDTIEKAGDEYFSF